MANAATLDMEMSDKAYARITARLERNRLKLAKLEREHYAIERDEHLNIISEDKRHADLMRNMREAKAFSRTKFEAKEKTKEEKINLLREAQENERPISELELSARAKARGIKKAAKSKAGLLQHEKWRSKEGLKGMASVGMEGIMHTAGFATRNPLFNLLAMGLGNRRRRILEAKTDLHEYEQEKSKSKRDREDEREDDSFVAPLKNIEESTASYAQGLAANEDTLKKIAYETEYGNMVLNEILDQMKRGNDFAEETAEDNASQNDAIKATLSDEKVRDKAEPPTGADETSSGSSLLEKFGAIGNAINGLKALGPIMTSMGSMLSTLGPAIAVVATAVGSYKLGEWIGKQTGLIDEQGRGTMFKEKWDREDRESAKYTQTGFDMIEAAKGASKMDPKTLQMMSQQNMQSLEEMKTRQTEGNLSEDEQLRLKHLEIAQKYYTRAMEGTNPTNAQSTQRAAQTVERTLQRNDTITPVPVSIPDTAPSREDMGKKTTSAYQTSAAAAAAAKEAAAAAQPPAPVVIQQSSVANVGKAGGDRVPFTKITSGDSDSFASALAASYRA